MRYSCYGYIKSAICEVNIDYLDMRISKSYKKDFFKNPLDCLNDLLL